MSPIAWLSREEIVALGWTLLHFCWQGTAVAVIFAMVDRITSHTASRIRYTVALATFMLMPIVVIGTFTEELRVATQASSPAHVSGLATAPLANQVVEGTEQLIANLHLSDAPKSTLHQLPLASSLEESTNWIIMSADRILPWVDALWLAGVLFLVIRSLGGWLHLGAVRRRAQRMIPQEVEQAFLRLCEQIEVGRKVVLRASDEVISPLAMGVWRATVILPISAVLSMPRQELEAVIAHELGHIRRLDYMWNLLQTAVESILFFHPAVWWLSRTVRERREICCDEIAVRSCSDAAVYARALLRLEEQRTVKLRLAMALGGCGGSLLGRVRKVLGEDMALESRMTSGTSVAAVGALVITLLLGPKISEAVAAPAATRIQPVVAHIKAMPAAVVSQLEAAGSQMIAPPAEPATPAPHALKAPAPIAQAATPQSPAVTAPVAATPYAATPYAAIPYPTTPYTATAYVKAAPYAVAAPAVAPTPTPAPHVRAQIIITPNVNVNPNFSFDSMRASIAEMEFFQESTGTGQSTGKGSGQATGKSSGAAYIDGMRDAGYPLDLNNDLNSLVALKSMGVTPEYAKSMATTGLGKPTVHELISLKSMGVTPEYVASLKQSGLAPKDFHEVVTEKSMGITPEYAAEMKQKGFGDLNVHELVTMKSLGVTPEYAADMKKAFGNLEVHDLVTMKSLGVTPEYAADMKQKGFGDLSVHELVTMKSLDVTPEYAAEMKQKGFGNLSVHELVSLKAQGMTPEYAGWLKQQFPQATTDQLRRAATFHLDDKFIAEAKSHGFDSKDMDKLLKLKMSGLLDQ
jgi:beta-lactamase regulating signal transducer with metallopeptidase domain